MHRMNSRYRFVLAVTALSCLVASTGCVGAIAQALYMWKGITVPAEYSGLEDKRVAVVCVSSEASFGPTSTASRLARTVGKLLQLNGDDISVISSQEVSDWIDKNNWDEIDYVEIGRGVNAEMVVAIDLRDYRLREGQTLLQGRASATITVYDMTRKGEDVFKSHVDDYSFPRNGYPTTEMSESRFDRIYLGVLAQQIARKFYESDAVNDYARDPATLTY
jgi:hypothetical protein